MTRKSKRFVVYEEPPLVVMILSSIIAAMTYSGGYYFRPRMIQRGLTDSLTDSLTILFMLIAVIALIYYIYRTNSQNPSYTRTLDINNRTTDTSYVSPLGDPSLTQIPEITPDYYQDLATALTQEADAYRVFKDLFTDELGYYNSFINTAIPEEIRSILSDEFEIVFPLVCDDFYSCDYSVIIAHVDKIISALNSIYDNTIDETNDLREQLTQCTTNNTTVTNQIQQLNNYIQQTQNTISALEQFKTKITTELGNIRGKLFTPVSNAILNADQKLIQPCISGVC